MCDLAKADNPIDEGQLCQPMRRRRFTYLFVQVVGGNGGGGITRAQVVAVHCSVLQCVAACCSVLQCVAEVARVITRAQVVAVHCSVLQCIAVCCSELNTYVQCVAVP